LRLPPQAGQIHDQCMGWCYCVRMHFKHASCSVEITFDKQSAVVHFRRTIDDVSPQYMQ